MGGEVLMFTCALTAMMHSCSFVFMASMSLITELTTPKCSTVTTSGPKIWYGCGFNGTTHDGSERAHFMYGNAYILVLVQSIFFVVLFLSFGYFCYPLTLKKIFKRIPYKNLNDLVQEVEGIVRQKLDTEYSLKEACLYTVSLLNLLAHLSLSFCYITWSAKNMNNSTSKAWLDVLFPVREICSMKVWPYVMVCELPIGYMNRVFFLFLWVWYVISAMALGVATISDLMTFIELKRRHWRRDTVAYRTMDLWLLDMCKDKMESLNRASRRLGLQNFYLAARVLTQEDRLKRYATPEYGIILETDVAGLRSENYQPPVYMESQV